jgi:hypothetical protein
VTKAEAAVMKASAARFSLRLGDVKGRSSTASAPRARRPSTAARVMPCRIAVERSRVTMRAVAFVTIQALFEVPSVTKPSSTIQASSQPAFFAIILHIEARAAAPS